MNYSVAEFVWFLQDLPVISFDRDSSFDSAEFNSRHLDDFERTQSVLSLRIHETHTSEKQLPYVYKEVG